MQRSLVWTRASIALDKLAPFNSEEKPHLILKESLQNYLLDKSPLNFLMLLENIKTFVSYEMTKPLDVEAVKVLTKLSAVIY